MGSSVSKTDLGKRYNKIRDLLDADTFSIAIVRSLSENEGWGVSDRQLFQYIKKAKEINKAIDAKGEYDKALSRCRSMYQKALEKGNIKTALDVHKDLCKLLGLYPEG